MLNKRLKTLSLAIMLGSLWTSTPLQAEDRALLIGVGKYEMESANLPGIDLDVAMMRKTAGLLGFQEDQIKIVMDDQATLKNVTREMKTWLTRGVKPDDRVLIYFSGHGTRIPDESGDEIDGSDEVLTMHDLKPVKRDGKQTLDGVLVDDELNSILRDIPSRNVFVMVDACHSGTSTKGIRWASAYSGVTEGVAKFFHYDGMPSTSRGFAIKDEKSEADNYVALAAAQDDEKSIATERGSLFTLGVKEAVEKTNAGGGAITPADLRDATTRYIAEKLDANRVFHPQLSGNPELANRAIRVRHVRDGHGPNWRELEKIAKKAKRLPFNASQKSYRSGDHLELDVEVPDDGYLNVIAVDAMDKATVLFPNKFHPQNRVRKGRVQLPDGGNYAWPAVEPFGPTLLVALWTEKPVDLNDSGDGRRNAKGILSDPFPQLSQYGLSRGFTTTKGNSAGSGAGMVVVEVKR